MTATSALDAESETLVNQALGALLQGNNTTISIAHRLSTIKRSDSIIVLSPDGTVAQQGSFKDLSQDPNGAFTKLMEWQMSGGETKPEDRNEASSDSKESLSEYDDIIEGISEENEGEGMGDEEALKTKGSDEAQPETVAEKSERGLK